MNQRLYLPKIRRRDCLRLLLGAPALTLLTGCGGLGQSEEQLSGQLSIAGATSVHPLIAAAARSFEQAHPNVTIQLRTSGSLSGLEAMEQHQADITFSDTYADPILYPDLNLSDSLVCVVSFAMIVHPTLSPYIPMLSQQRLVDIYSTNTMNWRDIGGPDLPIIPVVRGPTSGTRAIFRKLVLGGHDESAQTTGILVQKDTSVDVLDFVRHEHGAIGYIAVALVDSSVRTVALEGISPTPENVLSRKYSFWSFEHVYTLNEDRPLIAAFLNFLSGSEVQDLVSQLHYQRADSPTLSNLRAPTAYGT